jgi:putative spermidine/putrescine transport system permease protein
MATVVIVIAAYFLIPLIAMAVFSFDVNGPSLSAYQTIFEDSQFWSSLELSLLLALGTTVLVLVLMVPTVLWVHMRAPRLRVVLDTVTLLPFVVPPIALVVGVTGLVLDVWPGFLGTPFALVPFYVILALPFTYRSLDAGLRAVNVGTLVEAARSCGASTVRAVTGVVLPNMRTALLGAAFLTITVVLGEFVLASLLLYDTLPVYMAEIGASQAQAAAALALISLLFTWVLLGALAILSRRLGGPGAAAGVAVG